MQMVSWALLITIWGVGAISTKVDQAQERREDAARAAEFQRQSEHEAAEAAAIGAGELDLAEQIADGAERWLMTTPEEYRTADPSGDFYTPTGADVVDADCEQPVTPGSPGYVRYVDDNGDPVNEFVNCWTLDAANVQHALSLAYGRPLALNPSTHVYDGPPMRGRRLRREWHQRTRKGRRRVPARRFQANSERRHQVHH